jgi:branched-chain amino acid transport system ATP-binding protein
MQEQLLALARCLCGDPQLILLDESTEGVQRSIVEEISDKLIELNSTRKLSFVILEQDVDFLTRLSQGIFSSTTKGVSRE